MDRTKLVGFFLLYGSSQTLKISDWGGTHKITRANRQSWDGSYTPNKCLTAQPREGMPPGTLLETYRVKQRFYDKNPGKHLKRKNLATESLGESNTTQKKNCSQLKTSHNLKEHQRSDNGGKTREILFFYLIITIINSMKNSLLAQCRMVYYLNVKFYPFKMREQTTPY